mmetsp:Transcript_25196/g.58002  ORF Transcript_25196/g.58002 Transcript_25196/m.58002 type:complete len:123 (-) Transcript_25196:770-1138(-)
MTIDLEPHYRRNYELPPACQSVLCARQAAAGRLCCVQSGIHHALCVINSIKCADTHQSQRFTRELIRGSRRLQMGSTVAGDPPPQAPRIRPEIESAEIVGNAGLAVGAVVKGVTVFFGPVVT